METAVVHHGRKALPPDLDDRTLLFAKLIRDADKLDIFRIVADIYRRHKERPGQALLRGRAARRAAGFAGGAGRRADRSAHRVREPAHAQRHPTVPDRLGLRYELRRQPGAIQRRPSPRRAVQLSAADPDIAKLTAESAGTSTLDWPWRPEPAQQDCPQLARQTQYFRRSRPCRRRNAAGAGIGGLGEPALFEPLDRPPRQFPKRPGTA